MQTADPIERTSPVAEAGAGRMEAFSDGVIAIIVTIMVLELRPPEEAGAAALIALWPTFAAYLLSFVLISIYWVNHHHLLQVTRRIGTETLWLNIHFLFWLSLFPFATAYVGETRGAAFAVAAYAGVSALVAVAFLLLTESLARRNRNVGMVAEEHRGRRLKNLAAFASMLAAIPLAFVSEPLAIALLVVPALAYFVPDSLPRARPA